MLGDTAAVANIFKIVRIAYPSVIANSLVSVQPMARPTGISWLKYRQRMYYDIPYKHFKIGTLVNMYRHFVEDDLREVQVVEGRDVFYWKEFR